MKTSEEIAADPFASWKEGPHPKVRPTDRELVHQAADLLIQAKAKIEASR